MISGGGSNFKALLDNMDTINGEIVLCISNRQAEGLKYAKDASIDYYVSQDFDQIEDLLEEYKIDLIVLGGYLKILPKSIVKSYANKIINIHPSLIPSFSGMGYYGLRVHEAAIKRGVKVSGATSHFVNEQADEGPIIIQKTVEVLDEDRPEDLQKRILEVEHTILPESVRLFCDGKLKIENDKVVIK